MPGSVVELERATAEEPRDERTSEEDIALEPITAPEIEPIEAPELEPIEAPETETVEADLSMAEPAAAKAPDAEHDAGREGERGARHGRKPTCLT